MKSKKEEKNYRVPMKWEFSGYADVRATSVEEAMQKCKDGQFNDGVELNESAAELINWEVFGIAKEDN